LSTPLLEARDLVKTFGRVRALRGANFSVFPGEVVALIGDNGAGKTVLVKCPDGHRLQSRRRASYGRGGPG
jgi:simple sugar transport system ATP-binding protein